MSVKEIEVEFVSLKDGFEEMKYKIDNVVSKSVDFEKKFSNEEN
jgi:hypothetical protein